MRIIRDFISPNSDDRPIGVKIDYIIVHYTEMIFEEALTKLCDQGSEVSCHYLIKDSGEIYQLVDDAQRAWHAGRSFWKGISALNINSIGIELDNSGDQAFSKEQIDGCIQLCKKLMKLYAIPKQNIIGHSDIAPNRKLDPGLYFDWELLAQNDIGMWYALDNASSGDIRDYASIQRRLKMLGYQIDTTGLWDRQTSDVIRAFQSHFCSQSLIKKGLDFYNDMNNEYFWDLESEKKLNRLLALK